MAYKIFIYSINMKTFYYNLMLVCMSIFALSSCKDDDMELDKGSSPLQLEVSGEEIVLDQFAEDKEAVKFSWGAGSNQGTGAAISYTFEMDLKDNNFAGGLKIDLGKTASHFISYTNKELNDSLKKIWSIPVDDEQPYTFEARVTADVADPSVETQVSNVATFSVTPYKHRILRLYLIGDATPGGWAIERATPMTMDSENKDVFTWEGRLENKDFRFICQNTSGTWWPGFVKDPDNEGKAKYFATNPGDDNDIKFMIDKPGTYRITINTSTLDVVINPIEVEEPEPELYLIGDATDGGWEVTLATKMNYDKASSTFEWEGTLKGGPIRFVCQNTSGDFWPGYAKDMTAEGNKMVYYETEPSKEKDKSFDIILPGKYKITANISTLDVVITPIEVEDPLYEKVWMIGSATSIPGDGWSWPDMIEMTPNGNLFTWTGDLKEGEIKFSLAGPTAQSFTGKFVFATKIDANIITDTGIDIREGEPDNKWNLSEDEAGTYTITIDFNFNKISFEKQN